MATQASLSRIAISRILVATDFSPESQNALQYALALARRLESKLYITHVTPQEIIGGVSDSWAAWPPLVETASQTAQVNMAQLDQDDKLKCLAHESIIRSGDPGDVISQIVSDRNVDLIVMAPHRRSGMSLFITGSTTEKVIRHSTCPVLAVGPGAQPSRADRFSHILYATDFSSGSTAALTYALELAEQDRAELTMLHIIVSKPGSDAELIKWSRHDRETLRQLVPAGLDLAYKPEIEVEIGDPAEQMLLLAGTRSADLIVMGSHGGTLATHFPWTTLHHVLQSAPCPLLTVRSL